MRALSLHRLAYARQKARLSTFSFCIQGIPRTIKLHCAKSIDTRTFFRSYTSPPPKLPASERVTTIPADTAGSDLVDLDHSLGVLLNLIRNHVSEEKRRGTSVRDILLESMPLSGAPALDLEECAKSAGSKGEFEEAISRQNPHAALKTLVSIFYRTPFKTVDQFERIISASGQLLQKKLATQLLQHAEEVMLPQKSSQIYVGMLGCYAKFCDFPNAEALFTRMRSRGVPIRTAAYVQLMEAFVKSVDLHLTQKVSLEMDKAFVRNRHPFHEHIQSSQIRLVDVTKALEIYRQVLLDGQRPNLRLFTLLLLLASRLKNLQLAEKALAEMTRYRVNADDHVCSLVTHVLATCGRVQRAETFMNEFHQKRGSVPSRYALNSLLASFTKMGSAKDAMRIYETITSHHKPSFVAISMIFGMFLDLDRLPDALHMLDQMKLHGYEPGRRNYNHLLSYYLRKNLYSQFFALVDHMRRSGITDCKYMRSMVITMEGENGKLVELRNYWEVLKGQGDKTSISPAEFSLLLRYALESEEDTFLRDVVDHLKKASFRTSDLLHSSRTLIYAFARLADFDSAYHGMREMGRSSKAPDTHMFNLILHSAAVNGQTREAERFFALMQDNRCASDDTTAVFSIYFAGESRDLLAVEGQLGAYLKSTTAGLKPEPIISAMAAFLKCRKPQRACELFESLLGEQRLWLQSESLCSMYIEALVAEGRVRDAWQFVAKMQEGTIEPSIRTFNVFLDHYSQSLDQDEFDKVLYCMEEGNVQPNAVSFALCVRLQVKKGNFGEAERLIEQLAERDPQMADLSRSFLIVGMLQNSRKYQDELYWKARAHQSQISHDTHQGLLQVNWERYYRRVGHDKLGVDTKDVPSAHNLRWRGQQSAASDVE